MRHIGETPSGSRLWEIGKSGCGPFSRRVGRAGAQTYEIRISNPLFHKDRIVVTTHIQVIAKHVDPVDAFVVPADISELRVWHLTHSGRDLRRAGGERKQNQEAGFLHHGRFGSRGHQRRPEQHGHGNAVSGRRWRGFAKLRESYRLRIKSARRIWARQRRFPWTLLPLRARMLLSSNAVLHGGVRPGPFSEQPRLGAVPSVFFPFHQCRSPTSRSSENRGCFRKSGLHNFSPV